ncbi:MAG: DUF255 domain-containing protein [Thermoprotei archaeon]
MAPRLMNPYMDRSQRTRMVSDRSTAFSTSEQPAGVVWRKWTTEAFEAAKEGDKPVFAYVYANWCRFCSKIEAESLSNQKVVDAINSRFIPVRVDRDEFPELDHRLQAFSTRLGFSGLPLLCVLLPDGTPFASTTYLPPSDDGPLVLEFLKWTGETWIGKRSQLAEIGSTLQESLKLTTPQHSGSFEEVVDQFALDLLNSYDSDLGGVAGDFKLPAPCSDRFLLHYGWNTGVDVARDVALKTFRSMVYGGIMDQVGGGFHRLSRDSQWWVPSFEKLLLDNAEVMVGLSEALSYGFDPDFSFALNMGCEFMLNDLFREDRFANSVASDSEEPEGAAYTWTRAEALEALGSELFPVAREMFGLLPELRKPPGSPFEAPDEEYGLIGGRRVLRRLLSFEDLAARLGKPAGDIEHAYLNACRTMLNWRKANRRQPSVDDSAYTFENSRACYALIRATPFLRPETGKRAVKAAETVLSRVGKPRGRRVGGGGEPRFTDGIGAALSHLALYQLNGDPAALAKFQELFAELKETCREKVLKPPSDLADAYGIIDAPGESEYSMFLKASLFSSVLSGDEYDRDGLRNLILRSLLYGGQLGFAKVGSAAVLAYALTKPLCHILVLEEPAGAVTASALSLPAPLVIVERALPGGPFDHLSPKMRAVAQDKRSAGAYLADGKGPYISREQLAEVAAELLK